MRFEELLNKTCRFSDAKMQRVRESPDKRFHCTSRNRCLVVLENERGAGAISKLNRLRVPFATATQRDKPPSTGVVRVTLDLGKSIGDR